MVSSPLISLNHHISTLHNDQVVFLQRCFKTKPHVKTTELSCEINGGFLVFGKPEPFPEWLQCGPDSFIRVWLMRLYKNISAFD